MIQLEFQIFRLNYGPGGGTGRRRKKAVDTAIEYTLKLSSALRVYNLSHALHDVLCAVAKLENEKGFATIPTVCGGLACTYQCVMQHLFKNAELFIFDESYKPRRIQLSTDGLRLLHKIKTRISRHE